MNPDYKLFHPKWHRTRIPIFWWLRKLSYIKFISRELTSVIVAYSAALLLVQLWALARGEDAYRQFAEWLRSPPMPALHVLVVVVLLFHTVTWLNLAPKALVVRLGGKRLADGFVVAAHYGALLVVSALIAVLVGG